MGPRVGVRVWVRARVPWLAPGLRVSAKARGLELEVGGFGLGLGL